MGCGNGKSFDITLNFQGVKKQLTGKLPDYCALNEWIIGHYPLLKYQPITLKTNGVLLESSRDYADLSKTAETVQIDIEKLPNSIKTPYGIVKVYSSIGKMIATGFLINKLYVLVPQTIWNLFDCDELKIVFAEGLEIELAGGKDVFSITEFFTAAKLKQEINNYDPLFLKLNLNYTQTVASVLYYTEKLPILQKILGKFTTKSSNELQTDLILQNGAAGSPVIAADKNLIGVYASASKVISVSYIAEKLTAIPELYKLNLGFEVPDIVIDSYSPTTCYLDTFDNKFVYYSSEDTVKKSLNIVVMAPGCCAAVCSYGIVVTGCSEKNLPQAWLFDGRKFKKFPGTNRAHLYHCSIEYKNKLYVVSGGTTSIEVFNSHNYTWTVTEELEKKRDMASIAVTDAGLYVFGGKRDGKVLRSIITFDGISWRKINFFLPVRVLAAGCIALSNKVLVFGGDTPNGKNKSCWEIDFGNLEIKDQAFTVLHNFGRFPACSFKNEVLYFSNEGELIRYDLLGKKIQILIVDEEELNIIDKKY
jgi:hypothetical protein